MILGLLVSGDLGLEVLKKITHSYSVHFVMTDKKSFEIITYCRQIKIPIYAGNPRNPNASRFYSGFVIDVLISINYLFIIEENLIKLPKRIAFNIHGSLLPKYRGRTPHVWAIINNEKETGITAHLIDKDCDTGSILQQEKVEINFNDTGKSILDKYKLLYYPIITDVLNKISNNKLYLIEQDNTKATYFGKRTANDGQIDWNWHRERIRNWVRAQSFPYPGAFTFYENQKIVIDKVSFSDFGFTYNVENGTILQVEPDIIIKTPNGSLQIDSLRCENVKFDKYKIFE
jgi:methionyl-tRNA formyltransferase